MKKIRIIPRLDIKGPNVIKGIHLEGLRVVGKPNELAKKYYEQGADELLYIDSVASLYGRENLLNVVRSTTKDGVYIPLTVGGGIRTLDDISNILRAGADKVSINTGAVKNPHIIKDAAEKFGSQCIVGSIEALSTGKKTWEAYIENGRQQTGLDVLEWVKELVELGAGEILLTSIDKEGTRAGFDFNLISHVSSRISVPIIVSGGAGKIQDIESCLQLKNVDAIAIASLLHYSAVSIPEIKHNLSLKKIPIRFHNKPKGEMKNKSKKRKIISIVDYGLGNLRSVCEAFIYLGYEIRMVYSPKEVLSSKYLVLPGVGAFGDGIKNLKSSGLDRAIQDYSEKNKPLLGICLGAQLLFSESEEFGIHEGLDIISGSVKKFIPPEIVQEKGYRVPHIGWNDVTKPEGVDWSKNLFSNIENGTNFYFVHSFYMDPKHKGQWYAKAIYGGQEFCAVVRKGNIVGCQFHPEKSGYVGLELLEQFCNL